MKNIIYTMALLLSFGASVAQADQMSVKAGQKQQQTQSAVSSSSSSTNSDASNAGNNQSFVFNAPATPSTTTANVNYSGGTRQEVNYSGGTTQDIRYSGTTTIKNTPDAFAPALTSSNDTCMGSSSAGGSGAGFGISIGSTWTDSNCKMLKNARELYNMGMHAAALARLCMDSDNKEALELTGFTCPTKKTTEKSASKDTETVYSLVNTPAAEQGSICDRTDDEFIRMRNSCD